jgi:hypothetical protein
MQEIIPTVVGAEYKETHAHLTESIFAFAEQPSLNGPRKKEEPGNTNIQINGSELFSLFTADIIKEKIIFTR